MDKQTATSASRKLDQVYRLLLDRYGPQHWWPGDSPFEVIVGAILTQSAAWVNVEKAIQVLKERSLLDPSELLRISQDDLARLIFSSGYYNAKARKLKAFVERLEEGYGGSLSRLFALDTDRLRDELLSIHGIGEETADSIILYAAGKPMFVIDAYTRRVIDRLGLRVRERTYAAYQSLFMERLPHDERLFNEYHALLVRLGKETCRKKPDCSCCCLETVCKKCL
ncbi:MAG: endonuclease [Dehalococcoidia bacterium]|nr:endonuclease [Dehalococcoidia bacterium]